MFVVKFFENKNLLLTQLLNRVPEVGENLTIKGKKGQVSSVSSIDETHIQINLTIEKKVISKNKLPLDNSKKKKR